MLKIKCITGDEVTGMFEYENANEIHIKDCFNNVIRVPKAYVVLINEVTSTEYYIDMIADIIRKKN